MRVLHESHRIIIHDLTTITRNIVKCFYIVNYHYLLIRFFYANDCGTMSAEKSLPSFDWY